MTITLLLSSLILLLQKTKAGLFLDKRKLMDEHIIGGGSRFDSPNIIRGIKFFLYFLSFPVQNMEDYGVMQLPIALSH